MPHLFHRYLALALCLLALAAPACLLPAAAESETTAPFPDEATPLVLDYTGTLNCESDLWNNENYLEEPTPSKD
jgi:hypothetical protein